MLAKKLKPESLREEVDPLHDGYLYNGEDFNLYPSASDGAVTAIIPISASPANQSGRKTFLCAFSSLYKWMTSESDRCLVRISSSEIVCRINGCEGNWYAGHPVMRDFVDADAAQRAVEDHFRNQTK